MCFLCGLSHAKIEELCFLCVALAEKNEKIREWELTSLEFGNSKRPTVLPEEELEDLVCDVTCALVNRYWEYVI
jgi:hypothetical protein